MLRPLHVVPLLFACSWIPVVACTVEEPDGPSRLRASSSSSSGGATGGSDAGSTTSSSSSSGSVTATSDAGSKDGGGGDAGLPKDSGAPTPPPSNLPPNDPCANVTCPAGQACVSEAHGQPLGVCVDTCDCSNCGNCAYDNSDGRWNDMQEYCGNLKASPATKACNKPCGGGAGCIYYGAVNICWPLEGCFSL